MARHEFQPLPERINDALSSLARELGWTDKQLDDASHAAASSILSSMPPRITRAEIPDRTEIRGLGPIGVVWHPGATWRNGRAAPRQWPRGVSRDEFSPCEALIGGVWHQIRD